MTRFVFKLPDVGEGIAEAELVAWHVKVGDVVIEDQPLVDVMTDKATVEMTSPVAGVVASLHGELGQKAAIGGPLVEFEIGDTTPPPVSSTQVSTGADTVPATAARSAEPPQERRLDTILTSPSIRRRARESGVNLADVKGTGPKGRIRLEDWERHLASRDAPKLSTTFPGLSLRTGVEEIRVIGLRRQIAEKMQEAKRHIPHFSYIEEVSCAPSSVSP